MDESKIINGKEISDIIKAEVKRETEELKAATGITPGLAFILIGDDPASEVYVRSKGKACDSLGFYSVTEKLQSNVSEIEVLDLIQRFNDDNKIHGILVQLPLPRHINEEKVIEAIDYRKDVDGFHPVNFGRLVIGSSSYIPCTPYGIVELLKRSKVNTNGANAVVIGRSNIVGKPIANLMLRKEINSTVSICHSATNDLRDFTLNADIIIVAMGKAEFIKSDMIKEGSVVIDVGINRVDDTSKQRGYRLTGDVDFNSCFEKVSKITPVPGGVGPMTIAMLMKNTLDSAKGKIYR